MKHYICTGGCGTQSDSEGVCEAQFCTKEGMLLTECNCEDGSHVQQTEDVDEYDDADVGE